MMMVEILSLGLPPTSVPMGDVVRVRELGSIYPSSMLTNIPYTANNQMLIQPPASEFMDIFPIFAQLVVTWRWR